jgi:hypothetical protein
MVLDNDGLNGTSSESLLVKMPTSVSISTSSTSTTVGYSVNINGTLNDCYGKGLANQTLIFYYTFSGAKSWLPITSITTDDLGQYSIQWIPTATGYFTIKAEWGGNYTYIGTNNTVTVSTIAYKNQYIFTIESNSTISNLTFNSTNNILDFTASGINGTMGYTKVTIPKSLVPDKSNVKVIVDGKEQHYTILGLDDSWVLTFEYSHSIHQMQIELGQPSILESLSFLLVALLIAIIVIVALLIVIVHDRKHRSLRKA